jgi:3-deoxy-D-manno-octulosonate 8-phosphate phosphatase (KDO 8-P phosphatase)
MENQIEKIQKIKLFILDVDGVLTDGKFYVSDDGKITRAFDAKDGYGLHYIMKKGIAIAIISGKDENSIRHRAKTLGITELFLGSRDKLKPYRILKQQFDLRDEEISYIGDDVFDIPILEKVGFSCCPCDAVKDVKNVCDYVCKKPGGNGAVREVTDLIVKHQQL